MRKQQLAICDTDAPYVHRVMDYINLKKNAPFEVLAFSSLEDIQNYCHQHVMELLLLSEKLLSEDIKQLPIAHLIVLAEEEKVELSAEYQSIYKYQSIEAVIREVIGYYAVNHKEQISAFPLRKEIELIAVYSPVKRALKTSFSLALGQILSKQKSVLYLNMEEYSGFSGMINCNYKQDFSDLLYYLKQKSDNLLYRLSAMVQTLNNLDYIPPVFSHMDLRTVTKEEWLYLLDLLNRSSYDVVILDLGDIVDGLFEILRKCEKFYMPVREDSVSLCKIEQFQGLLTVCGYEDVSEKIEKLRLPYYNHLGPKQSYLEQLIWSELGDYVRELVRTR